MAPLTGDYAFQILWKNGEKQSTEFCDFGNNK